MLLYKYILGFGYIYVYNFKVSFYFVFFCYKNVWGFFFFKLFVQYFVKLKIKLYFN